MFGVGGGGLVDLKQPCFEEKKKNHMPQIKAGFEINSGSVEEQEEQKGCEKLTRGIS